MNHEVLSSVAPRPSFCLACSVAAEERPKEILADKRLPGAMRMIGGGDHQAVPEAFEALMALDEGDLVYIYGMAPVERGDGFSMRRAGESVRSEFVAGTGRGSKHYQPELQQLLIVEAKPEAALRPARLEGQLPEILRAIEAQMVRVEGVSFTMGCTPEQMDCFSDEMPTRVVRINSFDIGRHEVTQELWEAVMGGNPSTFSDCPGCPVETVSWDDTQAFLARLNSAGDQYRLPTEAEWEYAARGGSLSQGHQYAGSGDRASVAWHYENSDNRTHAVGQKLPNELGLHDMSGNVREWVQDCWHWNYEGAPADGSAWEQGNCDRRAIRGGSWYG